MGWNTLLTEKSQFVGILPSITDHQSIRISILPWRFNIKIYSQNDFFFYHFYVTITPRKRPVVRIPYMVRQALSESPIWSDIPCQNPIYGQTDPIRIPYIVRQTLSESPIWSDRPYQNPLYGQTDPVRIPYMVKQTLSESPIWSNRPCQNPYMVRHTLSESTIWSDIPCQNPGYDLRVEYTLTIILTLHTWFAFNYSYSQ